MTVVRAESLPECIGCALPVRRLDFDPASQRCPSCRRLAGVRVAESQPAREQLAEWTNTVARMRGDDRRRAIERVDRLAARRRNRGETRHAR